LDETGFPPGKLNLEITESHKFDFSASNLAALTHLKHEGVRIALDDFGTGYSSFENLIKISASILKIEKIFMDGIEDDRFRQFFLHMLVELVRYLDMKLVAEGVETEQQYAILRTAGVEYAQGYLFSKPLTYEQLGKFTQQFN